MPLRTSQNESDELRKLDLFADMQEAQFDALMRGAYVQNFPPTIELITEGEPSDFLHVVLEGSVELFAGWNGRETTMATVRPVSTFILAATIKDAPYLMSARTLEKSRLILLPSSDVREVFDADPVFARNVVTELAQCYRHVVKHSKNLKLRTSLERFANYLIHQQSKSGVSNEFDLPIEKRRLASYLGMTPENLSRAIKSLQQYGVKIDGQHVTIKNDTDLRRLAKPSQLIDDPNH
ncbi:cyclic nucleotide-binding domain-containing protein [Shimia sp. FJ5]|uniref:cyclic nucleotide-binding domain-containing protein n=1 Tax=Shimia sp. FJ5 TaxID=3079054 RepID=UPI00293DB31B|nr:cyclic nucleotide-binding domain-containing protein [Shimia sp. FJ5]MDV4145854.1 cyclic nucleotide-binding domain-containing protein [Shimia sp. FJ5]